MTQYDNPSATPSIEVPDTTGHVQELLETAANQLGVEPAEALHAAREAYELTIGLQNPGLVAMGLLTLGLVYTATGDPASARANFELAEKKYQTLPPEEAANLLIQFARNCSKARDYDTSLEYFDRALDYCRTYGLRVREAECLNKTGITHAQHRNYDLAFQCFRDALVIADELDKPTIRANVWINFGNLHRILGEFLQALEYFSKGLLVASSIDLQPLIIVCLNNIGIIYAELGEFSDALEYFLRCEMYLEAGAGGDVKPYANTFSNIGNLYEKLGNIPKALEYQQKALDICRRTGDHRNEAASLHNLAVTMLAMNEPDKAFEYATTSLAIREVLDDPGELALSYNNVGNILDRLGRHDEAISYHLRSITLCDRSGDRTHKSYFLLSLGSTYQHNGNLEQALECIRAALAMADELGARTVTSESFYELALVYRAMGDFETALHYHELYHKTDKEIFNDINSQKVRNLQTLHQVEQTRKEAEIYRLKNVELAAALRELEETNQELQAVNAERNELMNIVAHDLKNPLSSIMMLADILRNDNTLTQEEITDFSGNILTSSERMFNLITNLLDVNALENRLDELEAFNFDVVPIVQYTARQFQSRAAKKNIALHEIYEHSSIPVLADEDALLQVLDNIVSNAIKFSPEEKNIWITVRNVSAPGIDLPPAAVRIEVRDEGPGLSEEDKANLFQKFTPLSAQPTGGEHSTGLGLSIVKRLVESMRGRVWCESESGAGATFIIELQTAPPTA